MVGIWWISEWIICIIYVLLTIFICGEHQFQFNKACKPSKSKDPVEKNESVKATDPSLPVLRFSDPITSDSPHKGQFTIIDGSIKRNS